LSVTSLGILRTLPISIGLLILGGLPGGYQLTHAQIPPNLPTSTVVASARVSIEDRSGHPIHRARAKTTVLFHVQFTSPHSFPSGYTDIRFLVTAHGKAQRTVIYGTPKHLHPGQTVRVTVPVTVSRAWIGKAKIAGEVTLLNRPGGTSLHHVGRGTAWLTVHR
jgi:hypothetical protein